MTNKKLSGIELAKYYYGNDTFLARHLICQDEFKTKNRDSTRTCDPKPLMRKNHKRIIY